MSTEMQQAIIADVPLLMKWNKAIPRYTSYPTAPQWKPLDSSCYGKHLETLAETQDPLSLYFHIPFCRSMCLYCGCSVILNRRSENEEIYVDYLIREIDLVTKVIGRTRVVPQLHFGGGTPTKLSEELMERLFFHIHSSFALDFSQEMAMEIDPRTVLPNKGSKLRLLRSLGFNRVSFGIQDTNDKVQDAVKRRQSHEMSRETYYLARQLGFEKINIDLIYGLPHQTKETFRQTVKDIIELRPDRIALFSYAKVPWMKPHQNAIKEEWLPSTEEKFQIYVEARQAFVDAGYVALGMDHFAVKEDELAQAYFKRDLYRNFQGYTVKRSEHLLGLGVTAIGDVTEGYFQNLKELDSYYEAIDSGLFPVHRGIELTKEDRMRRWVINRLMCQMHLDKSEFESLWNLHFNSYFVAEIEALAPLVEEKFIENTAEALCVLPLGELFVRNIAVIFDSYFNKKADSTSPMYSQSV